MIMLSGVRWPGPDPLSLLQAASTVASSAATPDRIPALIIG
jgi:hypothetical protein